MPQVLITNRARKDLEALDELWRRQIVGKIKVYAENPRQHAVPLTDSRLGSFRFRIGDYRVVFDLEGDDLVVLRVGHRREIYR